jgi:hypothetical protein
MTSRLSKRKTEKRIKPESRFEKLEPALKALADFSNLESGDLTALRHKYEGFVPGKYWNYRPGGWSLDSDEPTYGDLLWKKAQTSLREVWERRFEDSFLDRMRLLQTVFDPTPWLNEKNKPESFGLDEIEDLIDDSSEGKTFKYNESKWFYPYHRAVLFLFEQPWRARFCANEKCRKRFIAVSPKTKACCLECRAKVKYERDVSNARKHNWYRK